MKKLVSLALAGICALAFATAVDAATASRLTAKKVQQGNVTVTGSGSVNINKVVTHWSQYAQDYASSAGGKYEVRSLYTTNLLNSQTVYDDLKEALANEYKRLVPSVVKESQTVSTALVTTGYGSTFYDPANANYRSISGIANNVIPGRVASLSTHTVAGVNTSALMNNTANSYTPEEAKIYIAKMKAAFELDEKGNKAAFDRVEAQNATKVANEVARLQGIYDAFLADQAAALAVVQADYDTKADILERAEAAYTAATNARKTALNNYNKKKNVQALETAYSEAQAVTAAAKADKEAKEASLVQAQADYDAAVAAFNAFDYDGGVAALEEARDAAIAQAQADLQAAYDVALAAKDAAEEAYIAAQKPTYETRIVEDEEGNEVEEQVEIAPDPEVVEAAFQAMNSAKGELHTATVNLSIGVDATPYENTCAGKVGELGAQLRALQGAVSNTSANLATATSDKDAAVTAYDQAVIAENAAKKALDSANSAKANAWQAYQDKVSAENAAKAARDTAQVNADAAAQVLAQLKIDQAAAKAAKLAELKSTLTAFIGGLKDVDGKAYDISRISGYANLDFNQVSYVEKQYQGKTFVEPQLNIVTSGATSSNSFTSVAKVTIEAPKYAMIDGVLTEITTVNTNLFKTTVYTTQGDKTVSPLVLDMAGNGVLQASNGQYMPGHDLVKTNNIIADFYGDGFEIAMEWVGPQDGLLVAPKADGSVDMSCLFGTAGGYENGYENLSLFDKNDDMKITGEELNGLSIWQDANGNGIADAGEVKTVKSLGITSINLDFNKDNFMSSFERNGQTYKMWDWWPNAVELVTVASAQ